MTFSSQSDAAQRRSRDQAGKFAREAPRPEGAAADLVVGDLTAAVEPAAAAEPAWKVLARQEAGWRADAAPGEPGSGMHALTPTTRPFAKDAFNVRFGGVNVGRITRSDGRHKWAATLIDTHGEIVDWAPDHKDFDKAVAGLMTAVAARVRDERERS